MSLASYVINFDELEREFEELIESVGAYKLTYYKGEMTTKSFTQEIPAFANRYKVLEWTIEEDNIKLMSILFTQNAWKSQDHWSLYLNDEIIMKNIFTKELADKKEWEIVRSLRKGDKLKIILDNKSGNYRGVWVDFTYLPVKGDD